MSALFSDVRQLRLHVRYTLVELPLLSATLAHHEPQCLRVLCAVHLQAVLLFRISAQYRYGFIGNETLDSAPTGQLNLFAVVFVECHGTAWSHMDQPEQLFVPPKRAEQTPQLKALFQGHVCHCDAVRSVPVQLNGGPNLNLRVLTCDNKSAPCQVVWDVERSLALHYLD